jgi:hypothetical protein
MIEASRSVMNCCEKRFSHIIALFLMIIAVAVPLQAENIRGNIAGILGNDTNTTNFKADSIVVIQPDGIGELQDGIELRIQIPQGLQQYQNSFAVLIYKELSPEPGINRNSYVGTRAYMRLLPSRKSTFIRIPVSEEHGITGDALTDVLPVAITPDQFPLILTIMPLMKGIPDSAFKEELTASIVPIWKNKGSLTINLTNISGGPDEKISVTVDGKTQDQGQAVILSTGIHRVRVTSNLAATIEKTVAIEPGKAVKMDLVLDYRLPEITVSAPKGAVLFLDGKEIILKDPLQVLRIESGTHVVLFRLGDVEIKRSFTVRPGSRVKIDLVVDIGIVEFGENAGSEQGSGDG